MWIYKRALALLLTICLMLSMTACAGVPDGESSDISDIPTTSTTTTTTTTTEETKASTTIIVRVPAKTTTQKTTSVVLATSSTTTTVAGKNTTSIKYPTSQVTTTTTTTATTITTTTTTITSKKVEAVPAGQEVTYVLNTENKKFHLPSCRFLPTKNRKDTTQSREELIDLEYEPCKKCKP